MDTHTLHPASIPSLPFFSTHSVLHQVLRRSNEIIYKVNTPKEIFFSFPPNYSFEGSFLKYIHYLNIKVINLCSLAPKTNDSNPRIILIKANPIFIQTSSLRITSLSFYFLPNTQLTSSRLLFYLHDLSGL